MAKTKRSQAKRKPEPSQWRTRAGIIGGVVLVLAVVSFLGYLAIRALIPSGPKTGGLVVAEHSYKEPDGLSVLVRLPGKQIDQWTRLEGGLRAYPPLIEAGLFQLIKADGSKVAESRATRMNYPELLELVKSEGLWEQVREKGGGRDARYRVTIHHKSPLDIGDGAKRAEVDYEQPSNLISVVRLDKIPKEVQLWVEFEPSPAVKEQYQDGTLKIQLRYFSPVPLGGTPRVTPPGSKK